MNDLAPPEPSTRAEVLGLVRAVASLPGLFARGTPWGDGTHVLVVPGFMTSDRSTLAIRAFLRRQGYRPHTWDLGRNHGGVYELLPRVVERLDAIVARAGAPVALVGWSLGGVLAREAARHRPRDVRRIVTMGTPVVGGPKYTLAAEYYRKKGIDVDAIERDVAERNAVPHPVPLSAIYSKNDHVVAWRAQLDDNPANDVRHVEVSATHAGLGFSAEALKRLAEELALDGGSRGAA